MRTLLLSLSVFALFGLTSCSDELRVSEVEPSHGTAGGGEEITIKGNGFKPGKGGVSVRFGKHDAASIVVESDTKIRVTTPGGDPGTTVSVLVVFDDGKAFELKNAFQYVQPVQQQQTMDKAFNALGK